MIDLSLHPANKEPGELPLLIKEWPKVEARFIIHQVSLFDTHDIIIE